jgi:hypothetical protein
MTFRSGFDPSPAARRGLDPSLALWFRCFVKRTSLARLLRKAVAMTSSGSLFRFELPTLDDTVGGAPGEKSAKPQRRSRATWPAMARSLTVLAEVAGRVNGLAAASASVLLADAQAYGSDMLAAIDDAMAAATLASSDTGEMNASLFAESADLVSDLAVISTWTLQRKRAELEAALGAGDVERAMDARDSARRGVIRALAAIERALLPPGAPGAIGVLLDLETERSLRTRALYRAFRATVRPDCAPTAANIDARLTAAGVALSKIFSSSHFRDLRPGDRRLFREIEGRLTAYWSAPSPLAGLRLFQDVVAFAGCLRAINNRAELVEHDARVAAEARASIPNDPDSVVDDGTLEALGALLGRDDELDDMLLGVRPARSHAVSALLASMTR